MEEKKVGRKAWVFADAFLHSQSNGCFPSHEAVCVLNTSHTDAHIRMTLFFEDREEAGGYEAVCPARRTQHIRLDKIVSSDGKKIPKDTPYALLVESDTEIVAQYSRMDTSQSEMALMTTFGYPAD